MDGKVLIPWGQNDMGNIIKYIIIKKFCVLLFQFH